ncbi:hypothetical protein [Enterococcus thailandicus]|uniref:hypothetical protein n=1 Tax=Enterococcus thailandicus TaxID=417368 RepID=UPI0028930762|nr:hypothetical protein [Enterococcus thailandicus]
MKSRHSSTKISVTLVRGKASGRVATSRFLADKNQIDSVCAIHQGKRTFVIIVYSNTQRKAFSLEIQFIFIFFHKEKKKLETITK